MNTQQYIIYVHVYCHAYSSIMLKWSISQDLTQNLFKVLLKWSTDKCGINNKWQSRILWLGLATVMSTVLSSVNQMICVYHDQSMFLCHISSTLIEVTYIIKVQNFSYVHSYIAIIVKVFELKMIFKIYICDTNIVDTYIIVDLSYCQCLVYFAYVIY